MSRRVSAGLCAMALVVAPACEATELREVPAAEPACDPGDGVLWGVADLHVHPASELSFAPRGVLWGSAEHGRWNDANVLDQLPSCPVETHSHAPGGETAGAGAPFDRTAHTLILPLLNAQRGFTHAPIGTAAGDGSTFDAWPNARDVLHQQLQVSSIYRAYKGGLRVMVASVTDNQALASLLVGPHFADLFVGERQAELVSAATQLQFILELAAQNERWMEVATCPDHAHDIVASGKLALLLSLEMEGLSLGQIDALVTQFPIAHVVPIHLVDNDFGATAAFSDIFNASSALLSEMFTGVPQQYLDVEHTTATTGRLAWPMRVESPPPPLLYDLGEIEAAWYRDLAYDCAAEACDPGAGAFTHMTGHRNLNGLERGGAAFRALMNHGVMLDVSHMSQRSAEEALDIAAAHGYPLIASHGGVGRAGEPVHSERTLSLELAARVGATGGMIGLGTEGGEYEREAFLVARGGPLARFQQGATTAIDVLMPPFTSPSPSVAAEPPRDLSRFEDPTMSSLTSLSLEMRGLGRRVPETGRLFAVVELDACTDATCDDRDRSGVRLVLSVPEGCDSDRCTLDFTIPGELTDPAASLCSADGMGGAVGFDIWDVRRVFLRAGDRCRENEVESWDLAEATVRANGEVLHEVSFDGGARIFRNEDDEQRAQIVLFQRADHRFDATRLPDGPLVHIVMRSAEKELQGAGLARYGTEVCVALLRPEPGCSGEPCCTLPIANSAVRGNCPPGFISVNQRGVWQANLTMEAFARLDDATELDRLCGARIEVRGWDVEGATWPLDELRVERMSDPVADWAAEYRRVSEQAFGSAPGAVAFGTDMNGFAPQLPISALPVDWASSYGSRGCSVSGLDTLHAREERSGVTRPVLLEERGLATYGMIADVMGAIAQSPDPDAQMVIDSLFSSADRAIDVWRRARSFAATDTSDGRGPRPCGGPP